LELQWSRDRARKEKTRRRRMKITRGSPRMASKKVRRRGLYRLPPVRIVFVFSLYFLILFCNLNI